MKGLRGCPEVRGRARGGARHSGSLLLEARRGVHTTVGLGGSRRPRFRSRWRHATHSASRPHTEGSTLARGRDPFDYSQPEEARRKCPLDGPATGYTASITRTFVGSALVRESVDSIEGDDDKI
ncbi:unnamed protein product [Arctogadus glacialis]